MRNLNNRVAVVTGAASGIGRATSLALAREGCDLAISDVNRGALDGLAGEIEQLGRRVCVHEVDVSDRDRMQAYAGEVAEALGGVNILVNNAGVTVTALFEEHSLEDFEWLLRINVLGVVYGCKFFLPHLERAGDAHIVNLSSVFGLAGVPLQTSYCASKFAVRGFSEALWAELSPKGIGVTSVHPAGVRTEIARSARGPSEEYKQMAHRLISKGISPEHAATRIVGAIKANKMRLLITREAYVLDAAKRMIPENAQRVISHIYGRIIKRAGA